jgi:hypothetical protein
MAVFNIAMHRPKIKLNALMIKSVQPESLLDGLNVQLLRKTGLPLSGFHGQDPATRFFRFHMGSDSRRKTAPHRDDAVNRRHRRI